MYHKLIKISKYFYDYKSHNKHADKKHLIRNCCKRLDSIKLIHFIISYSEIAEIKLKF